MIRRDYVLGKARYALLMLEQYDRASALASLRALVAELEQEAILIESTGEKLRLRMQEEP